MEILNITHYLLAYAGMIIYVLMKLAEVFPKPDFSFKVFIRENLITTIISIIAIPVLLIMATDSTLHDMLPVNYLTAVLCGYQTQSMLKSVFSMYATRKGLTQP